MGSSQLLTLAVFVSLLGFASSSSAVEISASVDRDQLEVNSTLNLTVEVSENAKETPDFSVLNLNFEILGTQQSTSTSLVNGSFSSKTIWRVTLIPKQRGFIIIPSITYKNIQSEPIKIKVGKTTRSTASKPAEPVFLEATLDKSAVYVQEQIVLTLRIFHNAKLLNGDLSKIDLQDAVIEQIGDQKSYQTKLKGKNYGVYEIKYAIYPQASGTLSIPGFTFNGSIAVNTSRSTNQSIFSPFMNQGRRVRAASEAMSIDIKPKPDAYPSGAAWLPAKDVKLKQSWNPSDLELSVGDPATRTIEIHAVGQAAVSIPALPELSNDSIKVYPDKSLSEDKQTVDGIIGVRTESAAVVPTKAGALTLPAVKVTWWDTDNDRVRETVLEAQTLTVRPGAPEQAPVQLAPLQAPAQATQQAPTSTIRSSISDTVSTEVNNSTTWKLLTAVMTLLWLVTLFFAWLFYTQREKAEKRTVVHAASTPSNKALLEAAIASCKENEAEETKQNIIQLCTALAGSPVTSLAACKNVFDDLRLNRELALLEASLYQANAGSWNNKELGDALKDHIKQREKQGKNRAEAQLAPLHPSS